MNKKTKAGKIKLPMRCIELILNQAGIIAITDAEARYVYVNQKWEEDTGISSAEALGHYNHDLIDGSRALTAIRSGKAVAGDVLIRSKAGRELPGVMTYMPIFDDETDKVVGCFISSSFLSVNQAYSFVEKMESITREYEFLKKEMQRRNGARYRIDDIIGESNAIKQLKEQIYIAGASDSTVLIEGETGTGKELVAHAIHGCSLRKVFPFVKVNCSAIPDNLMEAEFFGYEEGTFTGGAKGGKRGKFEKAHLGSIFLDEINHLSMAMQPKLLRVLQEKEIERLGTSESIQVDTRVIAAANVPLRRMIRNGEFREDLFYRLNIMSVLVPPLRSRREDIPLLAEHLLDKMNEKAGRNIEGIDRKAMRFLAAREWPGNVRELQNVIEKAVNTSKKHVLTREDFEDAEAMYDNHYFFEQEPRRDYEDEDKSLGERKKSLEKKVIEQTLEKCGNNRSQAAKMLNISRTLLYKKLKKYGLD